MGIVFMRPVATAIAFILAVAEPALAASQFYVVRALDSKECKVETAKPDPKKGIAMNSVPYKSKKEADMAIKGDPNCAQE